MMADRQCRRLVLTDDAGGHRRPFLDDLLRRRRRARRDRRVRGMKHRHHPPGNAATDTGVLSSLCSTTDDLDLARSSFSGTGGRALAVVVVDNTVCAIGGTMAIDVTVDECAAASTTLKSATARLPHVELPAG
jgi:hypothetical protein